MRPNRQKRPWLAALFAAFVTGLGHLYLRRWRRAAGWLAVAIGVGVVFVDPSVAESLATGTLSNPLAAWPVAVVSVMSVLDAYLLARAENTTSQRRRDGDQRSTDPTEATPRCPACGKEFDPELSFCQWCSTELDPPAEADQSTDQR